MKELTCQNCGHNWNPKTTSKPVVCPRCKSYKWDVAKAVKK